MKTMTKSITHSTVAVVLLVLLSFTFNNVIAQLRTPSSVGKYEKGTVTLENGDVINGYIFIDMMNPQEFQKRVNVIDEKAYTAFSAGENVDKAVVVYDANDLQSFKLENGKKFKQAKYANVSSLFEIQYGLNLHLSPREWRADKDGQGRVPKMILFLSCRRIFCDCRDLRRSGAIDHLILD